MPGYKYICNIQWDIWILSAYMKKVWECGGLYLVDVRIKGRKINLFFLEFKQPLYREELLEQRPDKACGLCGIRSERCDFHGD